MKIQACAQPIENVGYIGFRWSQGVITGHNLRLGIYNTGIICHILGSQMVMDRGGYRRRRNGRASSRRHKSRSMPFEVIYEDEDLLVVNKSAGVLSVPVPGSHKGNDALSILREHYGSSLTRGVFVVHRIDRFTSGILVFARNPAARRSLIAQFKNREPIREYLAVVRGHVKPAEGELKDYLKPIAQSFRQVRGSKHDRGAALAELRYKVRATSADRKVTLVSIWLKSGLKGQIRAQFETRGHPLIGDRQYAEGERSESLIDRQALHSYKITVIHPRTKKEVVCVAALPTDFNRVLQHFFGDIQIVTE